MEKVIRDGKVAVLVSPGYGAGWYSWNTEHKEILFHPKIVQMVESGKRSEINDQWMVDNIGIDIFTGGAETLEIKWLPAGTFFTIEEYDGNEYLQSIDDLYLIA